MTMMNDEIVQKFAEFERRISQLEAQCPGKKETVIVTDPAPVETKPRIEATAFGDMADSYKQGF